MKELQEQTLIGVLKWVSCRLPGLTVKYYQSLKVLVAQRKEVILNQRFLRQEIVCELLGKIEAWTLE